MKKILAIVLAVIMLLSFAACGSTPASSGAPSGEASKGSSEAADSGSGAPLIFTPKWSSEDVATEDAPGKGYKLGFGGIAYDPEVEITLEYCKAEDKLFTALNGESDWPAQLDDEWKGYGYTAISTTDSVSSRTLAVGQYSSKQAGVIKQYCDAMDESKFTVDKTILGFPEGEGQEYVPYCMLTADGEVTDTELAEAAHRALYIQAWSLVPAANQGVVINANGQTYTLDAIIAAVAK